MSVGIALKRGVDKVGPMAVWAARALEALAICTGEDCACTPTQVTSDNLFCFQAEDGIRDYKVTGVQTCALPILKHALFSAGVISSYPKTAYAAEAGDELMRSYGFKRLPIRDPYKAPIGAVLVYGNRKIGRASCRERV